MFSSGALGCAELHLSSVSLRGLGFVEVEAKFERARAVGDLQALITPPSFLATKSDMKKEEYRYFETLKFAIWAPTKCRIDMGESFRFKPNYKPEWKFYLDQAAMQEKKEYGSFLADTSLMYKVMFSDAVKFTCGAEHTFSIVEGSVLDGWEVPAKLGKSYKAHKVTIPTSQILITAVSKTDLFPPSIKSSPSNVFKWCCRNESIYGIEQIASDEQSGFVYVTYANSAYNVDTDRGLRSYIQKGLIGYYQSQETIYIVEVSMLEGQLTKEEEEILKKAFMSFRFLSQHEVQPRLK
jgi:hypothetical protein